MNNQSRIGSPGALSAKLPDEPPPPFNARERLTVGPLRIDLVTHAEFVENIVQTAFTASTTHLVATANAQFYVLASQSSRFAHVLRSAEFVCADGISIIGASRLLTGRIPDRIPGVDLIGTLCKHGADRGLRVFLLGGRPGSAAATAKLLLRSYEGIQIVGVDCPPFGFEEDAKALQPLLEKIRSAAPQIIFVGLGAPKQEFFINEHIRPIGVPIAVGVGGSFDMYSGHLRRAPQWLQKLGLEWGFRLAQEPYRLWKRYLIGNSVFCCYLLRDFLRKLEKMPSKI